MGVADSGFPNSPLVNSLLVRSGREKEERERRERRSDELNLAKSSNSDHSAFFVFPRVPNPRVF